MNERFVQVVIDDESYLNFDGGRYMVVLDSLFTCSIVSRDRFPMMPNHTWVGSHCYQRYSESTFGLIQ